VFNLSPSVRIFVCTKPVDMRRSFNGLFSLVQSMIGEDPFSGHLFLFRSRRGDFIKALWWDLDGFAIFAKRLEIGTFQFPDVRFVNGEYEPIEIERAQLMMLLEGIDSGAVKRLKRYRHQSRDRRSQGTPKAASNRSR
jgi:transposase